MRTLLLAAGVLLAWGLALDATVVRAQRPIDAERALVVERTLYRHAELIGVEVQSMVGFLYLRGTVPSEAAERKALRLGGEVAGIQEVRNRIQVRAMPRKKLPDAEVAVAVMQIIAASPGLKATVRDGKVAVRGQAPGPVEAHALVSRLRRLEGVRTLELGELGYAPPGAQDAPEAP